MTNGELSPGFMHPMAPWIMEGGSVVMWIILFAYCWRQSRRAGELTFGTLVLLSAQSMFWLEWYADWGAYLLYNPAFKLLPWFSTWWVTPNKPALMFFSYGWFYYGAVTIMLALIAKFRARNPGWGHVASVMVVAYPFFYVWDLWLEWTAALTGWWSYVYYIGPASVSDTGNFPFLHPIALYALSGAILCLVLSYRDAKGHVWFERHFGVERIAPGFRREAARLVAWMVIMPSLYWFSYIVPLNLIREAIGIPNVYVP